MCGYFCIEFIDFMLKYKSLTDFTNLFHQIIKNKNKKKKKMIVFFKTILKMAE